MGQRDAPEGEDADYVVDPGVLAQRGRHAQRNPDDKGDSDAHEAQLQRHRQALQELGPDAAAADVGLAPVEGDHVDEPGAVLPPEGPVEAQLRAKGCPLGIRASLGGLGAGAAGRDDVGGVARGGPQRGEDGDGDEQQGKQALKQASEHVDAHVHGERVPAALRRRNDGVAARGREA